MSRWFRMDDDMINHPKVLRLSDGMFRAWVTLLCMASKNDGKLPPTADIAVMLRLKPAKVAEWITALTAAGLFDKVDGNFVPHNWDKRQFKSDTSTERVKRFRERRGNVSDGVSGNVSVTPPQAQAQTEAQHSTALAPRAVQTDLVEEALRADLREVLGPHVDLSRVAEWLRKEYDPGMVREVVREVRRRKPDVASLAYFDAALADRHSKRALTPSERAGYEAVTDFDKVIAMFVRTGVWSRYAGPEPGMLGCRAPRELLAKHGIDATNGDRVRKAS